MINKALDFTQKELDVTTVLIRLRVLERIAKVSLNKDQWTTLWNDYGIVKLNESCVDELQ